MKLLRNPIVTGILALAAVVIVFYQVVAPHWQWGKAAPPPAPAPAPPAAPAPASAPPRASAATLPEATPGAPTPDRPIDRAYAEAHFAAWVNSPSRDPFLLLAPEPPAAVQAVPETNSPVVTWKLKAIWNQTGNRLAVINHGVYREGDEIQGYRILKIEGDEVWFQGPTRNERLGFERRRSTVTPPPPRAGAQPPPRP